MIKYVFKKILLCLGIWLTVNSYIYADETVEINNINLTEETDTSNMQDFTAAEGIESEELTEKKPRIKLSPEVQNIFQSQLHKMQNDFQNGFNNLLLSTAINNVSNLDVICENLAQIVNHNQLKKINKQEAIQCIRNIREILAVTTKIFANAQDIRQIKMLNTITLYLVNYLRKIIKTSLTSLPAIDLQDILTRNQHIDDVNAEDLHTDILANQKEIASLQKSVHSVGLTWFNKLYRATENFCSDHKVLPRAGILLISSILGYIVLSRIDTKTIEGWTEKTKEENAPIDTKTVYSTMTSGSKKYSIKFFNKLKAGLLALKKWTGEDPKHHTVIGKNGEPVGVEIINQDKLGPIGKIESFFGPGGMNLIDLRMQPVVNGGILLALLQEPLKELKGWLLQKWLETQAYLRGTPIENKPQIFINSDPRYTFADVIGQEQAKIVFDNIVQYLADAQKFLRSGIPLERCILLAGPTRSGKSHLAEALGGEVNKIRLKHGLSPIKFISVSGAQIAGMHKADPFGFKGFMGWLKSLAPCLLFIDEIDMAHLVRENPFLSELLTELSGCLSDNSDIVIVAATNMPERLDHALLQKGRFGKVIWLDYPSEEERLMYLKKQFESRAILSISEDFIKRLAKETEGCSFEELKAIVTQALRTATNRNTAVNEEILEAALDEEVRQIQLDSLKLNDEQKTIIASHLAGHIVTSAVLNKSLDYISKVTIRSITKKIREEAYYKRFDDDGKAVLKNSSKDQVEHGKIFLAKADRVSVKTRTDTINEIKIALAGFIAEEILNDASSFEYHQDDKEDAFKKAQQLVNQGIKEKDMPKKLREKKQEEALELLARFEEEVRNLLLAHKDQLTTLARALKEHITLANADLREILKDLLTPQEVG